MKKKVLSLLLATAMVVSMAACGAKDATEESEKSSGQEEEQQKEATDEEPGDEASAEVDWWEPYEETVTLEVGFAEKTNVVYQNGDDITDNPWIRSYKERFNIEVVPAFIESSEYATKVNLAMAEGNLPDMFIADASQLQMLIEADMICDLTEAFDTYASDGIKSYMEQEPELFESGKSDGKLYGVPQLSYGYLPQPNYVWIRKDWKENLNLEDPKTMDDVVNIAKAFMEEYGSKGIAVQQSLEELKILAPAWGAYPDIWVEDENGEIVYGSTRPEMKTALAEWANWYQEGVIDADFVTSNTEKIYEDIISEKFGVDPYYQWWGYVPGPDVLTNLGTDAYFEAYAIPSATGEEVLSPIKADNYGYLVVSKDCEHPEALMKLINFYSYMSAESDGVEDQEVLDAHLENMLFEAVTLRVYNPSTTYNDYVAVKEAWAKQDPSTLVNSDQKLYYRELDKFVNEGDISCVGRFLQQGIEKSAFNIGKEILDNGKTIKDKLCGITPETISNSGSTLNDILTEGFTKIIMGEESVDYFDTVIEKWKTAGGDQATAEMNEIYGE